MFVYIYRQIYLHLHALHLHLYPHLHVLHQEQAREMLCISNMTQYSSASLIGHILGFQLASYRRKYISRKIFSSWLNPSDDWGKIYLIHLFVLNIYNIGGPRGRFQELMGILTAS